MAYNPGQVVGGQVGIREDLADYIAVVDAKSLPLTSMAPKGKDLGNMLHSWQVDSYGSPVPGGIADGADVSVNAANGNASSSRTRLYNRGQVFRRVHRTGFIADQMNVAGVSDETARGVAKRLVELKRDMESTFLATNQDDVAEDNTPTASLCASLGNWLINTDSGGVGAPTSSFATPSGSKVTTVTASFSETDAQGMLTSIYGQTGSVRDYTAIVGTTLKRAFTNLTAGAVTVTVGNANTTAATSVRTFNKELDDQTFASNIEIFQGDFGRLILTPSVFIASTNGTAFTNIAYKGYVIPMDMVEIRYTQLPTVKDLPDAGGGPIKLCQAIASLVVKNPLGFGIFNAAS